MSQAEDGDGEAVYGVQPVRAMLEARAPVDRILMARGRHGRSLLAIVAQAREQRIPVRLVERQILDRLTGAGIHQGVVAMAAGLEYASREAVLDAAPHPHLLLILDGVQDPRNLGALLRTAAATGFHGVFIPARRAARVTATVLKAAAGTAGLVPVVREASLDNLVLDLKRRGTWLVAAAAGGRAPWDGFDFTMPTALILGGEEAGVRPLLQRRCDGIVGLPLAAGVESLNVSVALGALAYEVVRQRQRADK